ncbi:MAG: FkbM family methyltransferase [Nitrosomonas ureae]
MTQSHAYKVATIQRKVRSVLSLLQTGTLIEELNTRRQLQHRIKLEEQWNRYVAGNKRVRKRLGNGLRIMLYPEDRLSEMIFKETFEREEQKFVSMLLRSGDIFVDVGANIGLFSLIAGRRIGSRGRVIAFEPSRGTFERLIGNVRSNHLDNVECVQLALSDHNEVRELAVFVEGFAAWNSLARPTSGTQFETELVQCTTWDAFASQAKIDTVTLMKIDVEGWELNVLNGASQTLNSSNAPHLLVEFTDANAEASGSSCAAVYRHLELLGYTMYTIDTHRRVLRHDPLRSEYPYLNLLASKRIEFVCQRIGYSVSCL